MWTFFISWNRHRFVFAPFSGELILVLNFGGLQIGWMRMDLEYYLDNLALSIEEEITERLTKEKKEEEEDNVG